MPKALLELKGITKYFPGTKALTNVDLELYRGEVHGLIGENGAGKSTLMNIIGGVLQATEGEMYFEGELQDIRSPHDAFDIGIGFVHQELSLCPHISVAENIFMGRMPRNKLNLIDYKQMRRECQALLAMFKTRFAPKTIVGDLNVAEQQIVEIVKAISFDCKLLILDEPTSSLTEIETEELFSIINMLRKKGVCILYVSHRLSEIFRICDKVTVLRDGEHKGNDKIDNIDTDRLIYMMVGRKINQLYPPRALEKGEEIFRVEGFTSEEQFKDLGFSLYRNEILGFCGLVGAGRTELMRAICGIDKSDNGHVYINNKKVAIKKYKNAIDLGLVYLTEDRKTEGLFLEFSIKRNIVSSILQKIKKAFFVDVKQEQEISESFSKRIQVKANSVNSLCNSLSGGNQQKVLFAKGLACAPKVLIVDEPTRGIDVNAKYEIYKILRELCSQGIGIIIITSDLPEAIGMSDRVVVMHEGEITGIVEGKEINEETIMRFAVN